MRLKSGGSGALQPALYRRLSSFRQSRLIGSAPGSPLEPQPSWLASVLELLVFRRGLFARLPGSGLLCPAL